MTDVVTFLNKRGWAGATRTPLKGDASARRYERVVRGQDRAILMIDPEPEIALKFVTVTNILSGFGYSAPNIIEEGARQGFLLLEDFGDDLMAHLLEQGANEKELYHLAADFLIDLRTQDLPDGLPFFSNSYVLDQNSMFLDWYIPHAGGATISSAARRFYQQVWSELLKLLADAPEMMLLRDFHAENLFHLPERSGVKALGLIDYQDAMTGPAAYDLVSLLQDARRDVSLVLEQEILTYYLAKTKLDEEVFRVGYAILGAHRALRIMGIFVKLSRCSGKDQYLEFQPRMKDYLRRNLAHPALMALKHWLEITLGEKLS